MTPTANTIQRARLRFHAGRFHAAADLLLFAFRANPTDYAIARELGVVLHACGDLATARTYLSRAHFADPTDPISVAELVCVLHELGCHAEASQVLITSLSQGLASEDLAQFLQAA